MNPVDAMTAARRLMNEHGLGHLPLEWDRARRRLGAAHWRRLPHTSTTSLPTRGDARETTKITLSRPLVELNDEATVLDCILHEIAHALTPDDPGHGHEWKRVARRIGARPVRCGNFVTPPKKLIAVCPAEGCGQVFRRDKGGKLWCRCTPGYHPDLMLVWLRRGTLEAHRALAAIGRTDEAVAS